jgi:hypothetical protein
MTGDIIIRSTKSQLEDFKQSMIWKDIKRELGIWIRMAKDELLPLAMQCTTDDIPTNTAAKLAAIGGRIEAIHHILQIPDNFIQELEVQANARCNQAD